MPTKRKSILTKLVVSMLIMLTLTICPSAVFAGGWNQTTLLSAVTATGASTAQELPRAERKTFYISGASTPSATVNVESSADGTNWVILASVPVTGTTPTEVAVNGFLHRYVRANVSSYTSGSITVVLGWD